MKRGKTINMNCHKCQYNGMKSEHCLSCLCEEQYSYKYLKYVFDGCDAYEDDEAFSYEEDGQQQCTHLNEDDEDMLRKAMFSLFDLSPLELLTLQGIMQNKSLQEIADDLTKLFKKNNKLLTRHHVFQLRKSIISKIPEFKSALLTLGQRKELSD